MCDEAISVQCVRKCQIRCKVESKRSLVLLWRLVGGRHIPIELNPGRQKTPGGQVCVLVSDPLVMYRKDPQNGHVLPFY